MSAFSATVMSPRPPLATFPFSATVNNLFNPCGHREDLVLEKQDGVKTSSNFNPRIIPLLGWSRGSLFTECLCKAAWRSSFVQYFISCRKALIKQVLETRQSINDQSQTVFLQPDLTGDQQIKYLYLFHRILNAPKAVSIHKLIKNSCI